VWTFAKKVWTFEEKVWSFHFLRKLYTELFGALQINMYICTTFMFHLKPYGYEKLLPVSSRACGATLPPDHVGGGEFSN
jgi:hypothetical protein